MRILHLIYDHINNPWVGGGGAVRVYEIYRRLADSHHITVICGKYPEAKDYREGNLNFHFVGTFKNNYILSTLCYAVKAAQFLFQNSKLKTQNSKLFDIVIEDFAPYNPLFSKFIVKVPLIIQVHHREEVNLIKRYFIFGISFMFIEKFYPKLFKNTICVSEASRKKFGLSNAVIIPNGIDNELFETEEAEKEYISYLGRLHIHNKGLDTLIKAMKIVGGLESAPYLIRGQSSANNTQQYSKLIIAGKGKDELRLLSLIRESGLSEKIELTGHLSNDRKIEFLANSKIVIIPSRYEGQGIVILEAAACGKPVIVSDIPELRYAVDAGFGVSFKTGNAKDLADKIKFLLEKNTLRREMGQKARDYARNYTWDKIAHGYERVLFKVIGGK